MADRTTEQIYDDIIISRIARIVRGAFDVSTPDPVVDRESPEIARHAMALIRREVAWVETNRHPWRTKVRRD